MTHAHCPSSTTFGGIRDHSYIMSAYFWTFSDPPTHTLRQYKYSTERQQKLSFFKTHPPSPLAAVKLI
jgi:hypothetical protein